MQLTGVPTRAVSEDRRRPFVLSGTVPATVASTGSVSRPTTGEAGAAPGRFRSAYLMTSDRGRCASIKACASIRPARANEERREPVTHPGAGVAETARRAAAGDRMAVAREQADARGRSTRDPTPYKRPGNLLIVSRGVRRNGACTAIGIPRE